MRLQAKLNGDVHYRDYWYKTLNTKSYHRIYNRLVCPFDNSKPSITLRACGLELSSGFKKWSSCKTLNSTYCTAYLEVKSGDCKYNYYLGSIDFDGGCVYSYDIYAIGTTFYVDIYKQCPGTCNTTKPFFGSGSLSGLDAAGELIETIKIPVDGDIESDQ